VQAGADIVALDAAMAVRQGAARPAARGGLAPLQRCRGAVRLAFARRGAATAVAEAHQSGSLRLRFPRPEISGGAEAVLVNIGGGLTDGDRLQVEARWRAGTAATVTTQAAERIYRSRGPASQVRTRLDVAAGATALWLPQETILFDGSRLERRCDADVAEGGELIACESLVFGRLAMGETLRRAGVLDRWRVRYGGRLAFMDAFRLEGAVEAALARPAVAAGNRALATLLAVGEAAEARLATLRDMPPDSEVAFGATRIGPVTVARLLAPDLRRLHAASSRMLGALLQTLDTGARRRLPTVWAL
jgi:urease accessory protein